MIRVTCSKCNARLKLKDEFIGRKFRCPRCKAVLTVPIDLEGSDEDEEESQSEEPVSESDISTDNAAPAEEQGIAATPKLGKFNTNAVYFLVGAENLVGQWKLETGWQVKGTQGLLPAKTNAQLIPASGKFLLIEALCELTDQGKKLKKLTIYKLGPSDAAKRISGEPTAVLALITGYGTMTKNQKNAVLAAIKNVFMREIWGGAEKIREFLLGFDSHTSTIEEE
ncbi:MAG: hypothetical protein IKS45_09235 [Thermoguttaceae bacterium]|nr:hypothetical protein [Thermoguttaceae bacterium]